jgi:hypothetical protein
MWGGAARYGDLIVAGRAGNRRLCVRTLLLRTPDRVIGVERAALTLCLDDTWSVTCGAGRLSGDAAALPVDDQRDTCAMTREIVFAIMRYRS